MSTGTLLGVPSARGLFHKAILQSGAAHNVSNRDVAARVGEQFLEYLDVGGSPVKELTELPVIQLMRAQARTTARVGLEDGMMAWQPCVDGDLIPEQPLQAIGRGDSAEVPVLIGTNRDEFKLFMVADRIRLDDRKLEERLRHLMPGVDSEGNAIADKALEAYHHTIGPRGREASERWAAFQSDRIFHYPAARLADLQADHQAKTYAYLFEWVPPVVGRALGSCHGLELAFVFGGVRAALLRAGLVASPSAPRLCDRIQDAWIAFARNGEPGHDDLPDWPAYSRFCRYTMALGDHCTLREDPHHKGREFWEPLARHGEAARMF